ncbi:galectin-3b [Cheilinus undulatus]|uniref:galectin-3b n=1 Tax=Cheilinus undulatus TaxID=241271 RepID=UPI001BD48628|nr:galectin-3b [Cheilinus undulatus]
MWPQPNNQSGFWPSANNQSGGSWPNSDNQPGGAWPGQSGPNPPWQPGPQPANSGPGPGPGPSAPGVPATQQFSPTMPFSQTLRDGCYNNMMITIRGTVKSNANKFTVDLSAGRDIAFHFNSRFNDCGKKVMVRNSLLSNKWGGEEREQQHFPFAQGQSFEMKILCKEDEFRVAVNGSHQLAFRHRYRDLRSIKGLGIYGDVTLSEVKVENVP